jgi:hypothetical protein
MQQPAGWIILSLMPIAITPTLFLAVGDNCWSDQNTHFAQERQPCCWQGFGRAENPIHDTKNLAQFDTQTIDKVPKTTERVP